MNEPLPVFIHVACINHWQEILFEQLSCLAEVGVKRRLTYTIFVNLVGHFSNDERMYVMQLARTYGLRVQISNSSKDTSLCETPTIRLLDAYSRASARSPVLYMHSKGVAHPNSTFRRYWRWHMHAHLLRRLDIALLHLNNYSWVAASALNSWHPAPHASGNYFLTWTSFLKSLPPFDHYREKMFWQMPNLPPFFSQRHADEMWLGVAGHFGYNMSPPDQKPWDPVWWRQNPEEIRHTILTH